MSLDGQAMAVTVSSGGIFQAGVPKALFKVPDGVLFWDVTADGKRFLMTALQLQAQVRRRSHSSPSC